jgi:hypothetical protein
MKSTTEASFSSPHLREGPIDLGNPKLLSKRRRLAGASLVLLTLVGCAPGKTISTSAQGGEQTSVTSNESATPTAAPNSSEPMPAAVTSLAAPSSDAAATRDVAPLSCPITAAQAHDIAGAPASLLPQPPGAEALILCEFGNTPMDAQGNFTLYDQPLVQVLNLSTDEFNASKTLSEQPNASSTFRYTPEFGTGAWETFHAVAGHDTNIQMPYDGGRISVQVYEPTGFSTDPQNAASQLAHLILNK